MGFAGPVAKLGLQRLQKAHPARESYLQGISAEIDASGGVRSWFGRFRPIPKVSVVRAARRVGIHVGLEAEGLREAANAKVQMTAADVLKLTMRAIYDRLLVETNGARLVMTVHDEVVIECAPDDVAKVCEIAAQSFDQLPVELPVSFKEGVSWA